MFTNIGSTFDTKWKRIFGHSCNPIGCFWYFISQKLIIFIPALSIFHCDVDPGPKPDPDQGHDHFFEVTMFLNIWKIYNLFSLIFTRWTVHRLGSALLYHLSVVGLRFWFHFLVVDILLFGGWHFTFWWLTFHFLMVDISLFDVWHFTFWWSTFYFLGVDISLFGLVYICDWIQ